MRHLNQKIKKKKEINKQEEKLARRRQSDIETPFDRLNIPKQLLMCFFFRYRGAACVITFSQPAGLLVAGKRFVPPSRGPVMPGLLITIDNTEWPLDIEIIEMNENAKKRPSRPGIRRRNTKNNGAFTFISCGSFLFVCFEDIATSSISLRCCDVIT